MAAPPATDGWPALFTAAFRGSSNAMALVDERRCHVDVNGAYLRLLGHPRDRLVGRPVAEIADELRIAHETVRTHVRNAMAKAGARSRAHLVAKALAEGAIAV